MKGAEKASVLGFTAALDGEPEGSNPYLSAPVYAGHAAVWLEGYERARKALEAAYQRGYQDAERRRKFMFDDTM